MYPFIVLITRHVLGKFNTTQFDYLVLADSKEEARQKAQYKYPPIYVVYGKGTKNKAKVAFFTGEIYGIW